MNYALQLSFLLVVVGCLLGTGYCQSDDEFTAKGREIVADTSTKEFIDLYVKYSDRLDLTDEQRRLGDDLVKRYNDHIFPKIDCAPVRGRFRCRYICPMCPPYFNGIATAIDNVNPNNS